MIDKLLMKLTWLFPRRLVMWCAIRVGAHATTGKYAEQVVPELRFMDALDRWGKVTQSAERGKVRE